jgi:hypothetical protein
MLTTISIIIFILGVWALAAGYNPSEEHWYSKIYYSYYRFWFGPSHKSPSQTKMYGIFTMLTGIVYANNICFLRGRPAAFGM